jgi:hypothetical protein
MVGINKNSIEYKQGFMDGYHKAVKNLKKIKKEREENIKPIREIIKKLNNL